MGNKMVFKQWRITGKEAKIADIFNLIPSALLVH